MPPPDALLMSPRGSGGALQSPDVIRGVAAEAAEALQRDLLVVLIDSAQQVAPLIASQCAARIAEACEEQRRRCEERWWHGEEPTRGVNVNDGVQEWSMA